MAFFERKMKEIGGAQWSRPAKGRALWRMLRGGQRGGGSERDLLARSERDLPGRSERDLLGRRERDLAVIFMIHTATGVPHDA